MAFLFLCAVLSVVTTVGIVAILLVEAVPFFGDVSIIEFLTGTEWRPLFANKSFGALPLLSATVLIAGMAMAVAFPLGILTAIYLSEYAPEALRATVKPALEVLAGVPTVVYGFFAISFIAPTIVKPIFHSETIFTALGASLAMGIMLIPMVVSLSEDAMRAVPNGLREGAYALGANRFQVSTRVVVPAALSGIVAAGPAGFCPGHRRNDDCYHSRGGNSQPFGEPSGGDAGHDRLHNGGGHGRYAAGHRGIPEHLCDWDAAVCIHPGIKPYCAMVHFKV